MPSHRIAGGCWSRAEERLGTEFEDFDSHFLLEDDGGSTPLATGEGFGPYTLEWFPAAKSGTHLKAAAGNEAGRGAGGDARLLPRWLGVARIPPLA